jgi:hypothetical protein
MKRKILFKAKSLRGKWVEGDLIHGAGTKSGRMFLLPKSVNLAYVEDCHHLDGVEVIPQSICQFTGVTDNDGNMIFEKDKIIDSFNDEFYKIALGNIKARISKQ